ncbi:MAG: Oxidoreductase, short-chain dehydrogenase/reductase family, partial [uncultured Solirubrobacteraceae bacterium]
ELRENRSAHRRSPAALSRAAAGRVGHRGRDDSAGRSRRGVLPRLRPARGARGADHRRRQRHRPSGRHRLRARRSRRAGVLPRRARGRRGDRPPGRGVRPPRDRRRGRHRGRGALPPAGRPGAERPRRHRLPGQQRRLPADARLDRSASERGDRADLPDEHPRHVLALQGSGAAHEAGLDDHQHQLHPGLPAQPDAAALLDHQGRHRHLHQGPRPGADAQGDPGQ